MRRSIRWPPDLTGGRMALTADPDDPLATDRGEAVRQLVRLACLDPSTSNPWDLGLADRVGVPESAFAGAGAEAAVRSRLDLQFGELERQRRARLLEVRISSRDGERDVAVLYEDLEQGTRHELQERIHV